MMLENYWEKVKSLSFMFVLVLNHEIRSKTASTIFRNKLQKFSYEYLANFLSSNCSIPNKFKIRICIRGLILCQNTPTNFEKIWEHQSALKISITVRPRVSGPLQVLPIELQLSSISVVVPHRYVVPHVLVFTMVNSILWEMSIFQTENIGRIEHGPSQVSMN